MKLLSNVFATLSICFTLSASVNAEETSLRGNNHTKSGDGHRRRLLGSDCVRFYSDTQYRGKSYTLCRDGGTDKSEDWVHHNRWWNDKVSSIKVGSKVALKVYEDKQYRGKSREFKHDVYDLRQVSRHGRHSWNDAISGIKVVNNEPAFGDDCVRFYEHPNYSGKSYTVCGAGNKVDFASHVLDWNDRVSSIKVGKNVQARLFDGGLYKGNVAVFQDSVAFLGTKDTARGRTWDDVLSSIMVEKVDKTPHCALEVRDSNGGDQVQKYRCKIDREGQSCFLPSADPYDELILPDEFSYGVLTFKSHICTCQVSVVLDSYYSASGSAEYEIAPYTTDEPQWGDSYYRSFTAECSL